MLAVPGAGMRPGGPASTSFPFPRDRPERTVRSALEDAMNPEQRNPSLVAAVAVARRLLVRAIDIRFDLDEAVETANGSHRPTPAALERLRADAAALME